MLSNGDYVLWNNKLHNEDKKIVGTAIASLGELAHHDIAIHHRLIVTPIALEHFISENNLSVQVKHLLGTIDHNRHDSLTQVASYIRKIITHSSIPEEILKPLFKEFDKLTEKSFNLHATYFKDGIQIAEENFTDITGEAILAESVREAWSHLYSAGHIKMHSIHHKNHHTLSAVLSVIPFTDFSLTGEIRTFGSKKDEYEIEAHNMVKFVYSKSSKSFTNGYAQKLEHKTVLSAKEIKKLLSYAHNAEKALYLPHVLFWGKSRDDFLITRVVEASVVADRTDTYNSLIKSVSVHPGVVIGRLKVVDEKDRMAVVAHEEIIFLKSLDKRMLDTIKRAKGLILEETPHPEIVHLLKEVGIPTVIKDRKSMLYSSGDVISLNATTGEIKRGSMLVS